MNDFSDAFREGKENKQKRANAERDASATRVEKLRRRIQDAKKWMEMRVDSVVADAKAGLSDMGKISIKDISTTPHVGREIVFEMTGKNPYKVVFLAHPNGAVIVYRNGGDAEEFGNINDSCTEKVHAYLRNVVLEIGES